MDKNTVNFEEFQKMDLRAVKILKAEKIEGSEKLLKLKVDMGAGSEVGVPVFRQIIAGIGKVYAPESLINKEVVVITNLEPRFLMGLESQGMILAAGGADGPVLLVPDKEVLPGSQIR